MVASVLLLGAVLGYANRARSAPAVTFTTIEGTRIAPAEWQGQVTLVNFWATTCAVCAAEMQEMAATYRAYASSGFQLVAVAMPYDRPDWVATFAERRALPFPVALDYDGAVSAAFGGIEGTPISFLIDKRGRIIERIVGAPNFVRLRATIERELTRAS